MLRLVSGGEGKLYLGSVVYWGMTFEQEQHLKGLSTIQAINSPTKGEVSIAFVLLGIDAKTFLKDDVMAQCIEFIDAPFLR